MSRGASWRRARVARRDSPRGASGRPRLCPPPDPSRSWRWGDPRRRAARNSGCRSCSWGKLRSRKCAARATWRESSVPIPVPVRERGPRTPLATYLRAWARSSSRGRMRRSRGPCRAECWLFGRWMLPGSSCRPPFFQDVAGVAGVAARRARNFLGIQTQGLDAFADALSVALERCDFVFECVAPLSELLGLQGQVFTLAAQRLDAGQANV